MKRIFYLLSILSCTAVAISCSSDENVAIEEPTPEVPETSIFSKFVVRNFSASNNTVIDSTTYQLENDKVKTAQKIIVATGVTTTTQYSYTNDKIANVITSINGVIREKQFYDYQNNKISEFKTETYSVSNVLTEVNKHSFVQTGDTIYSDWNKSSNGSNFTLHMQSKIKLDNGNTVFYEGNNFSDINRITMQFDSNGNPLNEKYFKKSQGENGFLATGENNITYGSTINTFGKIMENTYGREVIMLLSHLESNAVNFYRVKKFSRNTLNSFESDFFSSTFTINNTVNAQNFAKKIDYIFLLNGTLFTKFQQEFYFN